MIVALDTSVVMKWVKRGERFDAEADDLLGRIRRRDINAIACEVLGLEVVRGLKNVQARDPALGFTDAVIEDGFTFIERMFQSGELLECSVGDAKARAKEIEITIGLYMADALHLATAVNWAVNYFVVDDHHFQTPAVHNYASSWGVQVVDLPTLIAALNAASAGPAAPTP